MSKWEELFSEPGPVKLYAMETGRLHMAGNIHFNKKDPRTKSQPQDKRFNPVYSFLVDHPREGLMVLDTGLHRSFAENKHGNFGWLLGSMVKTRVKPNKSSADQIKALGADLKDVRRVFLSHLHLDHPSGLPAFRGHGRIKVYVDAEEQKQAAAMFSKMKGYIRPHLEGFDVQPLLWSGSLGPFDKAWDVFGDQSVWIVATPGHTPGHASAVIRSVNGPFFLTFDAAHRRGNLDLGIPPIGDLEQGRATLEKIQTFINQHPQVKTIFGHDPDQADTLRFAPDLLQK